MTICNVVQEDFQMHYCSDKASWEIRKQIRKMSKNAVKVSCNCCYFSHFCWWSLKKCLDRLFESLFKRSHAFRHHLNNQGTLSNPQDQWLLMINKLLFRIGFPKNVCCYQSEDSSATPLFGINRQRLSIYSCLLSPIYVPTYVLTGPSRKFEIQEIFVARSFLLCAHNWFFKFLSSYR